VTVKMYVFLTFVDTSQIESLFDLSVRVSVGIPHSKFMQQADLRRV